MYTIDINGFTVNVKKDPNGVVLGLNNSLYFSLVKPGNILRLEEGKWLLMDTSKMTHAMKPKDFLDKASLDLSQLITEYKVGGRNLHLEYDEMFFFQALIYDLITDANMDWLRGKNIKFGEYYVEVKDDNSKISYYEYPRTFQTMEEFVSPPSASQPSIKNFMISLDSKPSPTVPIPTPKVSPALPIPKVSPALPIPTPKVPPALPIPTPKVPPAIPSAAPKLPPAIPSAAPKLPPTIPSPAPKLPPTIPSPAPKLPPTIPSPAPKLPPTIPSPAPKLPPTIPSPAPKLPPTIPSPAPKLPPTIPSPAPKLPPTIPSPAPKLPPTIPSPAPKLSLPVPTPKPSLPIPTPKPSLPIPTPKPSLPIPTPKLPLPVKVPTVPVLASPGEEEGPFALYKRLANMTEEERKRDMELNPTAYIKGRHYMEITTEEMTDDSIDTTE